MGRRNLGFCPLGKHKKLFFLFLLSQLVKYFCEILFSFFSKLFSTFSKSYFYMYIHVFLSFSWPLRAQPKGGGTVTTHDGLCHLSHLSQLRDRF